jgi:hypothetical protein
MNGFGGSSFDSSTASEDDSPRAEGSSPWNTDFPALWRRQAGPYDPHSACNQALHAASNLQPGDAPPRPPPFQPLSHRVRERLTATRDLGVPLLSISWLSADKVDTERSGPK